MFVIRRAAKWRNGNELSVCLSDISHILNTHTRHTRHTPHKAAERPPEGSERWNCHTHHTCAGDKSLRPLRALSEA